LFLDIVGIEANGFVPFFDLLFSLEVVRRDGMGYDQMRYAKKRSMREDMKRNDRLREEAVRDVKI
jgi:hypothetical protein